MDRFAQLFPPSPRVVYRRAPLVEVICQLRFPTLLSIESRPPVDFQERIRSDFPLLEKQVNQLPVELPAEAIKALFPQMQANIYRFLTEDRSTFVTLSAESLAFTTSRYARWERFRDQLGIPLRALVDIYKPNFFSRIGLRYQDAINRAQLGLADAPWSSLLRSEVLGEMSIPAFEENVEDIANREIRARLPDGSGSILLRHGLAKIQGQDDNVYMIDLDVFTQQRTEVADAQRALDHFNAIAGMAFRWCITDRLSEALGPVELAPE
jgi:uncharacterized protein (TIGR04255 family)